MNPYVQIINRTYDWLLSSAIALHERKKLSRIMHNHQDYFARVQSLDSREWIEKWKSLGPTYDVFFKYYSAFIGTDINIVPDDLMHNVIEPLLNPMRYRGLYSDKNMFDRFLDSSFSIRVTPVTVLRRINGGYYDRNYKTVAVNTCIDNQTESEYLVAKPAIDSSSGRNILFFDRINNQYILRDSEEHLTVDLLNHRLGSNYILQEGIKQSDFMSLFSPSSINTLRVSTYKSVLNEESVVLNGALRVGKAGFHTDNVHSGGCRIGIEPNGRLKKSCSDQFGNVFPSFNGIDFSANDFIIPNYERIKDFAKKVSSSIPHQRLLALDIALDSNNDPVLVEYNNYAFTVSAFQMTVGTVFGKYTDEVIAFCKERKKDATRIYLTY